MAARMPFVDFLALLFCSTGAPNLNAIPGAGPFDDGVEVDDAVVDEAVEETPASFAVAAPSVRRRVEEEEAEVIDFRVCDVVFCCCCFCSNSTDSLSVFRTTMEERGR